MGRHYAAMGRLDLLNAVEGPWWRFFLKTGNVTVLHVDLVRQSGRLQEALQWLDESDLGRYHRFLYPEPACRFALCRSAVRAILCSYLGCDNGDLSFGISRFEKPFALLDGEAVAVGGESA